MDILQPNIVGYLLDVIPERDPVLQEMEQFALERNFPIIGPLVGRLLYLFAQSLQARRILELGSGFGYSGYWFGKALGKDGEITCIDSSPENAERAAEYFRRGKILNKVNFLVGDATKRVDDTSGNFDIIFNDVNKDQYPRVFRKTVPRLRKGGLLISDNVLWSGRILDKKPDAETAGILTYNRLIYSSKELFSTIIPLRDGVSVSIKR